MGYCLPCAKRDATAFAFCQTGSEGWFGALILMHYHCFAGFVIFPTSLSSPSIGYLLFSLYLLARVMHGQCNWEKRVTE